MKKLLTGLMLCGAMGTAHADTVFGVYVGGQAWDMETTGGFANDTSLTNFSFDKEAQGTFYIAVEHFVPLLPNFKVRSTTLDTQGTTQLTTNFTFGNQVFTNNTNLMTEIDFTSTDYILYYEILDNNLVSLDLGLNFKNLDGSIYVASTSDSSVNAREELNGYVPMVYGAADVNLPFSGLGLFAEGSFLSIEDHTLRDFTAGIQYKFVDNIAVDLTLQLGYRNFKLELDDLDDIYSDIEFKGPFLGAQLHF